MVLIDRLVVALALRRSLTKADLFDQELRGQIMRVFRHIRTIEQNLRFPVSALENLMSDAKMSSRVIDTIISEVNNVIEERQK